MFINNSALNILLIHILLFTFAYTKTYSQNKLQLSIRNSDSEKYDERTISKDLSILGNNVASVLSAPTHWSESDILKFGGFAVLSGGSFLLDDEVRSIFQNNRNKISDNLAPIGYVYGSPLYTIPAALLCYVTGAATDNLWIRETGLMLTETLLVIGIVQIPTRIIMGRSRPYVEEGNISFKLLDGVAQDRASFISGHAAIAFGISNILSHKIDNPYATVGLFALASLTPLSRLYDDKHWFSDIFIGTALGICVSNSIINLHNNSEQNNFTITPTFNGIAINYKLN